MSVDTTIDTLNANTIIGTTDTSGTSDTIATAGTADATELLPLLLLVHLMEVCRSCMKLPAPRAEALILNDWKPELRRLIVNFQ